MRPASTGGIDTITRRARTVTPSASTVTPSARCLIVRTGAPSRSSVAERFGEQRRAMSCDAAHHSILLRGVAHADEAVHAAAGVRVRERVQQRHVLRLGREHRLGEHLPEEPRARGARVAAQPGRERLLVPTLGPVGRPRRFERNALREAVEAQLRLAEIDERRLRERRDLAAVPLAPGR